MPHIELKTTEGRALLLIHAHDFREALEIAINRGVCLDGLDAKGQNLRNANLDSWSITGADFSKSDLRGANLSECRLSKCLFNEADLSYACLCYTDLISCNLEKANLNKTDLSEASMDQCHLSANTLAPRHIKTMHHICGNRLSPPIHNPKPNLRQFNHPQVEYKNTNETRAGS